MLKNLCNLLVLYPKWENGPKGYPRVLLQVLSGRTGERANGSTTVAFVKRKCFGDSRPSVLNKVCIFENNMKIRKPCACKGHRASTTYLQKAVLIGEEM